MGDTVLKSVQSGKLRGLYAINTTPSDTKFCKDMIKRAEVNPNLICGKCYAENLLKTCRTNCIPRFSNNGRLLSSSLLDIWQLPSFRPTDIVRLSAYGELHNKTHLLNFCKLAELYYGTIFSLFTKRKRLIQNNLSVIPKNIIKVFSNYYIDKPMMKPPQGFDIGFNVFSAEYAIKTGVIINCSGECLKCMLCYSKHDPMVINEILRKEKRKWVTLRIK